MEADEIFKWFLASVLFGARIGESVVLRTFNEFERAGALCPEAIMQTGWDGLVGILDRGGYARYDFKTATKLMDITQALSERYAGDLNRLHFFAEDEKDLERKLQGLGKGIGPVTVNIFLRELRNIWEKAEPPLSEFALFASRMLGLIRTTDAALALEEMNEMWQENEPTGVRFPDFEAALTRLGKNYCLKNRCNLCVVTEDCQSSNYRKGRRKVLGKL